MNWTVLSLSLLGLLSGAGVIGAGIGLYMLIPPSTGTGWMLIIAGGAVLALSSVGLWAAARRA